MDELRTPCWKVVTTDDLSCNAVFPKNLTKISPYLKEYRQGMAVEKAPGSVGILCFSAEVYARRFIRQHPFGYHFKTIQVIGIGGKRTVAFLISSRCNVKDITAFYETPNSLWPSHVMDPPPGTIAFDVVIVESGC